MTDDYDPCTCGTPSLPRYCSIHPWTYRMQELERKVERVLALPVSVYRDQRIGAHACWYGSLEQWLELQPFVCNGCLQLVSQEFARTVLTYTAERVPQGLESAVNRFAAEREAKPKSFYEIAVENGKTLMRGGGTITAFAGGGGNPPNALRPVQLQVEDTCERCGRFVHPGHPCDELDLEERGG